jgi:hypothetical protein
VILVAPFWAVTLRDSSTPSGQKSLDSRCALQQASRLAAGDDGRSRTRPCLTQD